VRHDENQDAIVQWCPAKDIVLAERPVLVEATFEVHEVTALAQSHLLGKTRQLIQVRGKVSDTPYAGLR
jgi:hypothetical protein